MQMLEFNVTLSDRVQYSEVQMYFMSFWVENNNFIWIGDILVCHNRLNV